MTARCDLGKMSAIRRALMAEEARQQALPILRLDPIAIVGMACRTPGDARTPDALWRLLLAGKTTVQEIPADRFAAARWYDADPSAPGKIAATCGSFLDQIDQFDPEYFGIPPREVEQMDPQQRLALEVAIEAIDDAGVPHAALRGSRSGVFMACYHNDYARLVYENVDALDTRYTHWDAACGDWPIASHTSSTCAARALPSTQPAPHPWWPSTSPARACVSARWTLRSPAACR